uniref:Uncharacterized protein n=2 Tax=Glycine subgen. Soja TaxID=1462606 RepID=A0A0R0LAU2_SOYBN
MSRSGNGSNSSDANTGTSIGATSRNKNAPGNRTDIGWKHGIDVFGNDSSIVKMLMMKVVVEVANASEKRRKLNSIHEEGIHTEGVESNTTQSGIEGKGMLAFKGRGKAKFVQASGEGVQETLNQLYKKGDKDKVDDQCAEFWYTSVIPFNVIKNPAFTKFCDMVVDMGEKLLKRAVEKTDVMLQEFRDEWKRLVAQLCLMGGQIKKRRSIYNFLVNNIPKIDDKVLKMLDDVVNFVGEENVVQVITDNAANYKARRRITTYIYARTMLISIMKKFTNGRDLIRPACLHELKASLMSMFSSKEWKTSKFGTSQEGRKVQNMALDSHVGQLVSVFLRREKIDYNNKNEIREERNANSIYTGSATSRAYVHSSSNPLEIFHSLCKNPFTNYEPIWKIIDERPLHATEYYLNPHLHYEPTFRHDELMTLRGIFSMEEAKDTRKVMQPGEWWEMFGDGTPELKRFAIHHNWSSFEMVHTKRRNRLHQQKMNDLVYVIYNLKLKSKQNKKKSIALPFDEIESDDEWIIEEGYNDEDEQPQGESDGGNVELVGDVGGSSNDLVVDIFDLDNLILVEPNDDAQSEEDLDDDGDGDESDDIHGDDPIRELSKVL